MATLRAKETWKSFGLDFEAGRLYDVPAEQVAKYLAAYAQIGSTITYLFVEVPAEVAHTEREAAAQPTSPTESLAAEHLLQHPLETLVALAKQYGVEYEDVKATDLAHAIAEAAAKHATVSTTTEHHAA